MPCGPFSKNSFSSSKKLQIRNLNILSSLHDRYAYRSVCNGCGMSYLNASQMKVFLLSYSLTLFCCDKSDRISTDKYRPKLSLDFSIHSLFSVIKDYVDMDVERLKLADELFSAL